MKEPGDNGVQGYPIEELEVDPEATMADAGDLIDEAKKTMQVDFASDAVINLIDFRKDDRFYWESGTVPAEQVSPDELCAQEFGGFRVVQTNMFSPGLHVCKHDDGPGDRAYEEPMDLGDFSDGAYVRLLRDWLRGDVVPLKVEQRFVRADTGEAI